MTSENDDIASFHIGDDILQDTPMYFSSVLGWRAWLIQGERLLSIGKGRTVWRPGINIAYCPHENHEAPQQSCSCGFYAFSEKDEAQRRALAWQAEGYECVWGAVASRGEVLLHRDGFRAPESVVIAICDQGIDKEAARLLQRVYAVNLCSPDTIEAEALQYAQPVPEHETQNLIIEIMPSAAKTTKLPGVITTSAPSKPLENMAEGEHKTRLLIHNAFFGGLLFVVGLLLPLLLLQQSACEAGMLCPPNRTALIGVGVAAIIILFAAVFVSRGRHVEIFRQASPWLACSALGSLITFTLFAGNAQWYFALVPAGVLAASVWLARSKEMSLEYKAVGSIAAFAISMLAFLLFSMPQFEQPARILNDTSVRVGEVLSLNKLQIAARPDRQQPAVIEWQRCSTTENSSCRKLSQATYRGDLDTADALLLDIPSKARGQAIRAVINVGRFKATTKSTRLVRKALPKQNR